MRSSHSARIVSRHEEQKRPWLKSDIVRAGDPASHADGQDYMARPAYGGRQNTIMQLWAFSVSFNGGF
jgi:hypothetical protein